VARILDDAGLWVDASSEFWSEWIPELRANYVPEALAPARAYVGGADDIRYGNDYYRLGRDEALLIEVTPPNARYWQFQLCTLWFHTADYANRLTSLNGHEAQLDSDGRFRLVIAHEDPGVPNWLDTAGELEGMIQYRWIWTENNPEPALRRVKFSQLRSQLPADTPRISREQRKAQIHARQQHVARRFRL
jgi:hypothetical protein